MVGAREMATLFDDLMHAREIVVRHRHQEVVLEVIVHVMRGNE